MRNVAVSIFHQSPHIRSKQYRKVPIATINDGDDQPYFGSDKIIEGLLEKEAVQSRLKDRFRSKQMVAVDAKDTNELDDLLSNFSDGESSKKWTTFATDDLAPLLYPNICRTFSDSYKAFGYVDDNADKFGVIDRIMIKGVGSFAMYMAASKLKSK